MYQKYLYDPSRFIHRTVWRILFYLMNIFMILQINVFMALELVVE